MKNNFPVGNPELRRPPKRREIVKGVLRSRGDICKIDANGT